MLFKISPQIIFRLWSLSLFVFILLWFYPISYGIIRLKIVVLACCIGLGGFYLVRHQTIMRATILVLLVSLSIFISLPGRAFNLDLLKQNYLSHLSKYENTTYIWGGENSIGIDCSGLVRKGLIKANFEQGILNLNPDLIRMGFSLWWHDSSAEALRDEYRNYTKQLFASDSINTLDYNKIHKGDMAVTQDGVHILAYLGNKVWIEADPIYKKVIKVSIPELDNPWFNTPVYILRWEQFI